MTVREFDAPDGRRWRVWEVRPNDVMGDQRTHDRRTTPVEALTDPPALERRRGPDRRQMPARRRRALPGQLLPGDWQEGWLVFETVPDPPHAASAETLRLAPIPSGWDACSPAELVAHLRQAADSARGGRHR